MFPWRQFWIYGRVLYHQVSKVTTTNLLQKGFQLDARTWREKASFPQLPQNRQGGRRSGQVTLRPESEVVRVFPANSLGDVQQQIFERAVSIYGW